MLIRFWGTRGSLPVSPHGEDIRWRIRSALRQASGQLFTDDSDIEQFIDEQLDLPTKHGYGGNTSCVEIESGSSEYVICDMGSGLREFGQKMMTQHGPGKPQVYNFIMSHVHWDHIMGFPFFPPAYIPGNTLRIYGCHDIIEQALRRQHSAPCFPVDFDLLGSNMEFIKLEPNEIYEIAGMSLKSFQQPHPGDSYGYRFEQDGKAVVYTTDAEHKLESRTATDAFVDFLYEADLVIFDSMYSLADMVTIREDWGHSSNIIGVDLCHRAKVKHYCMFHHEPAYDDQTIYKVLQETLRYEQIVRKDHPLEVSSAYDGREIVI